MRLSRVQVKTKPKPRGEEHVQRVHQNILSKFIRPTGKIYKSQTLLGNKIIIKTEETPLINSDYFQRLGRDKPTPAELTQSAFARYQAPRGMQKSATEAKIGRFQREGTRDSEATVAGLNPKKKLKAVQTQKKIVNPSQPPSEQPDDDAMDFGQRFYKNRSSKYISNLISSDVEPKSRNLPSTVNTSEYWFPKQPQRNYPANELESLLVRFFSKCFVYLSKIEHLRIKLHKENIESWTYSLFRLFSDQPGSRLSLQGLKAVLQSLSIVLGDNVLHRLFWLLSGYKDAQSGATRPMTRHLSMSSFHRRWQRGAHSLSYGEFRGLFTSPKILIPEVYLESDWNSSDVSAKQVIPYRVSTLMRQIVLLKSRFIIDVSETIENLRRFPKNVVFKHLFLGRGAPEVPHSPVISNLPSFSNNNLADISRPEMRRSLEVNTMPTLQSPKLSVAQHQNQVWQKPANRKGLNKSKSHQIFESSDQNIVITDFMPTAHEVDVARNAGELSVDALRQFLDFFNVRYLKEDLMLVMNVLGASNGSLFEGDFAKFISSSVWNMRVG